MTGADPSGLYVPESSAEHRAEYDRDYHAGNGIREWVGRPWLPPVNAAWWDPLAPLKALYNQACDLGSFAKHTALHPVASAKYLWNHPREVALRGMMGGLTACTDTLVGLDVASALTPGPEDEAASMAAAAGVNRFRAFLRGLADVAKGDVGEVGTATRPSEAFHHTFADNVPGILSKGLKQGSYATTTKGLAPLQAKIELSLDGQLRDAVVRIDLNALRGAGYDIPRTKRVLANFNLPGGGYEVEFPYEVPSDFLSLWP